MGPLDALWHLLNLLAPALGVALIATIGAKLMWRRGLASVPFQELFSWSAGAGVLVLLAGLVVFERDGKMLTYAALVVSTALVLWWKGLRRLG